MKINFLNFFWFPLVLIAGWIIFLKALNIKEVGAQQVVLGIILGTSLGFIAEILKKSWDDFQRTNQIKRVAKTLLAQDALSIYRTMELYKRFMEDKNTSKEINKEALLPPELDLKYWQKLSTDKDFILLAGEDPFKIWYQKMFTFEKLNKFKQEADSQIKDEALKDKFKPMAGIYMAAYRNTVDGNEHKNFALNFYSEEYLKKELKPRE